MKIERISSVHHSPLLTAKFRTSIPDTKITAIRVSTRFSRTSMGFFVPARETCRISHTVTRFTDINAEIAEIHAEIAEIHAARRRRNEAFLWQRQVSKEMARKATVGRATPN